MRILRLRPAGLVRAAIVIAISGLLMVACFNRDVVTPAPSIVPSASMRPTAVSSPAGAVSTTPSPTFQFSDQFAVYNLNGIVYGLTGNVKRNLPSAVVSYHYRSPDLQEFNGQVLADPSGNYQLPVRLRASDDLTLIASAPGYLPTTIHLNGIEFIQRGTRLDFVMVKANGAWPTVPGDVGPFQVSGFVYDAARGQSSPIGGAEIQIHTISIVHAPSIYNLITDSSGGFSATMTLHSTDQVNFIVEANDYYSTTLIRSTAALTDSIVAVGLQPINR